MEKITFEDIQKASESIKTTDIRGKAYAEVNQRIKAFRMLYPQGFIKTELIKDEDGICIFKAIVGYSIHIFNGEDGLLTDKEYILGTGYARENQQSSFINAENYLECAETSAVGRALGMCAFGIDTAVASYEEMKSVENAELHNRLQIQYQINKLMNAKKVTPDVVVTQFNKKSSEMSDEELLEVVSWLESLDEKK